MIVEKGIKRMYNKIDTLARTLVGNLLNLNSAAL